MLKDQNNPAVLGSIAEVLKKSQEVAAAEQAKDTQVAQEKYSSWKLQEGKTHTVPKTEKEKKLAALAEPKDKITHADVMKGRGINNESVEQIDELKKSTLGSYIKKASSQAVTAGIVGTSMGAGHKPEKNKPEPGSKQYAIMRKREAGVRKATDKLVGEEWEAIEEALDPRIAKAFDKVAKGVEVHMKHKETGKISVAKFPGGMNAVKAAKEHEAEMGKQGYEVHKRKIMEEKTLSEILDEARGRPRKNPAPVAAKKSDEDDGDDYGPDRGPEADQNIQNHLKKAIDSEGQHHVKFADGSSHKVPADVAHKVLGGLQKLKPADRAKAQDHIYQSHKNLMSVHKMLG